MCFNLLVRSLCGALVFLLLVALSGHAQSPDPPTGGGRISGRMLTSTSEPIPDATVLLGLNDTGVAFESSAWWVAMSDHNGLCQFADLPAGPFILIAAKQGYAGWGSIPTAVPAPIVASRPVPGISRGRLRADIRSPPSDVHT